MITNNNSFQSNIFFQHSDLWCTYTFWSRFFPALELTVNIHSIKHLKYKAATIFFDFIVILWTWKCNVNFLEEKSHQNLHQYAGPFAGLQLASRIKQLLQGSGQMPDLIKCDVIQTLTGRIYSLSLVTRNFRFSTEIWPSLAWQDLQCLSNS